MIAFARKNLAFHMLKHTSSPVCRSPVTFLLSFHFYSTSIFDILAHRYDFPPEFASRVASELIRLKNPEEAAAVLSFFKQSGFSNAQLESILKYGSRFLGRSLEDIIKPKIKMFEDVGFSSGAICKIISSNPSILELDLKKNIAPSLSVLKGMLGSNDKVARVVRINPRFLTSSFRNTVLPNIEFLKSCGVPMERILIILAANPCCFTIKLECMRKYAEKAKEMGINPSSQQFIYAIPTFVNMSNEAWELKLQAFRDMGFSDSDILAIFRKEPLALRVSVKKITEIIELLLSTGKYNVSSIVNCPRSLGTSIQKRYIPRLQILEILESKNLIEEWPGLGTICRWPDDRFSNRFISPYVHEIGGDYTTKSSPSLAKRR